jgi:hypothetical protein
MIFPDLISPEAKPQVTVNSDDSRTVPAFLSQAWPLPVTVLPPDWEPDYDAFPREPVLGLATPAGRYSVLPSIYNAMLFSAELRVTADITGRDVVIDYDETFALFFDDDTMRERCAAGPSLRPRGFGAAAGEPEDDFFLNWGFLLQFPSMVLSRGPYQNQEWFGLGRVFQVGAVLSERIDEENSTVFASVGFTPAEIEDPAAVDDAIWIGVGGNGQFFPAKPSPGSNFEAFDTFEVRFDITKLIDY